MSNKAISFHVSKLKDLQEELRKISKNITTRVSKFASKSDVFGVIFTVTDHKTIVIIIFITRPGPKIMICRHFSDDAY